MSDDLVKRLRSPEVFIDTGGMFSPVAHLAADRIEALEQAIRNWAYTMVDWEGIDYVDRIENKKSRFLIELVVAEEKKDE